MSQSLFYVFICSYIGCKYVNECNICFVFWFFCHFIMYFFTFLYGLCFKVFCLIWILLPPLFCHFCLHEISFFCPLTFSLCVSFALMWVSCRCHIVTSLLFSQVPLCVFQLEHLVHSDQIRSVTQSCPTLCDPMNRSTQASLSITNSRSSLRKPLCMGVEYSHGYH